MAVIATVPVDYRPSVSPSASSSRRADRSRRRAMTHVLSHTTEFQKGKDARADLSMLVGAGVLVAEGKCELRDRRTML